MFILQETPIINSGIKDGSTIGAFVNFQGLVRNDLINQKRVSSLYYYANAEECIKEGQLIVNQSINKFNLIDATCIQRIGNVNVQEVAIWIGTWSTHRNNAFEGCRYIIEETKKRLLIWKKEYYKDGSSCWIPGPQTPVII